MSRSQRKYFSFFRPWVCSHADSSQLMSLTFFLARIILGKMSKLTRFGVSLETNLLTQFDAFIDKIGYQSRSEAIRDLIRERLVSEEWKKEDQEVLGIISLVYNHASREVTDLLTRIQHRHLDAVISSTHIHLDEHNCLEVIILKGQNALVTKIADELLSTKSVKHGKLIRTTTGQNIS